MVEIKNIATASIDPKSTVNVRRSQVKEGVEKVKLSIAEHGFWRRNPIVVRPHPDSASEYEYEVVAGQCRLKACLALGIEQIPAEIQEIDDDNAIRLSWAENEGRSPITPSDKAYWADIITTKYRKQGKNKGESRTQAAKDLGVSVPTIIKYQPLCVLPDDVMRMVDDKKLRVDDAVAIVESCVGAQDQELEQKIRERAEWIMPLDQHHKKAAVKVLKEVGPKASIDDLDKKLAGETKNITFEVTIPEALHPRLKKWGDDKGLIGASESLIGSSMVATMLSGR
ncbi:MAG: ParB/RepB/Spo0J family partition protein [Phycisphaerae bacterium]|nr:ParB/RepB/Spo0J family partition protein [Phycisphaerae bacterium]